MSMRDMDLPSMVPPDLPDMIPAPRDGNAQLAFMLERAFSEQKAWIEQRFQQQEDNMARLILTVSQKGDLDSRRPSHARSEAMAEPSVDSMETDLRGSAFGAQGYPKPLVIPITRQSTTEFATSDSDAASTSTAEPTPARPSMIQSSTAIGLITPQAIEEGSVENEEIQDLVSDLEDMFERLDVDKSGTINREELRKSFGLLDIPVVSAVQHFVDNPSNMEIDRLEWLHMLEDASSQEPDAFIKFATRLKNVTEENGSIFSDKAKIRFHTYLRHDSQFRMIWDMVIMVLLAWVTLSMPFVMGFGEFVLLSDLDTASDILFLTDVVLNFRTTYIDKDDRIVSNGKKMALAYLKTWFLLDFVSSVPWETVSAGVLPDLQSAKLLKMGKIAKVFKLLRLGKMIRSVVSSELLEMIEDQVSPKGSQTAGRVLQLVISTSVVCHWLACFMAVFDEEGMNIYLENLGEDAGDINKRYVSALYWAVTTLTTVGYGDIVPKTNSERAYFMAAMMIGSAFYGYIIGCITSVITDMDVEKRKFNERMDVVQYWLDFHERMPAILRRRIRRHFKEAYMNRTIADDAAIVSELSGMLRSDTAYFIIHEKVRTNPVFRGLPGSALASLVCVLKKTAAKMDEKIVISGDPGTAMYVIIEGHATLAQGSLWMPPEEAQKADASQKKDLVEGDSFGEELIFALAQTYNYTIVATTVAVAMYELSAESFQHQFRNMPELVQKMYVNLIAYKRNPKFTRRSTHGKLE
mmetsp:Transcript_101393/g.180259  ORF Transcript_101393/g.180259 Transcript_101393/m.180259 type:complete len:749 (-) Transcript_101393:59-2305(-)